MLLWIHCLKTSAKEVVLSGCELLSLPLGDALTASAWSALFDAVLNLATSRTLVLLLLYALIQGCFWLAVPKRGFQRIFFLFLQRAGPSPWYLAVSLRE